jgi:hypothetical protein
MLIRLFLEQKESHLRVSPLRGDVTQHHAAATWSLVGASNQKFRQSSRGHVTMITCLISLIAFH